MDERVIIIKHPKISAMYNCSRTKYQNLLHRHHPIKDAFWKVTSTLVILMIIKVKHSWYLCNLMVLIHKVIFNYWASQNPWVCQFKARDICRETRTLWQWRHWHCSFSNKIEVWNVTLLKYEIFLGVHSTKSEKNFWKVMLLP